MIPLIFPKPKLGGGILKYVFNFHPEILEKMLPIWRITLFQMGW